MTNQLALPKLEKIVINMGVGKATQDKAAAGSGRRAAWRKITGQKPQVTKAKVAVTGFRLREGNEIGCKVTLRGQRMYEFLDRLITIALPRIRDFRGVNPKSFDGHGNYSLGLTEQVGLPRDRPGQGARSPRAWTSRSSPRRRNDDEARELLRAFGMPFRLPQQPR